MTTTGLQPPDSTVEPIFATPLITADFPDAAALNRELEAAILARRATHPGLKQSNLGGWHSEVDLFQWAGEASHELARRVILLADAHSHDLNALSKGRRGWLLEAWANVNEAGASNAPHSHGGAFWSAVYYVAVGEGSGGELRLHDPRLPAIDMHAPDLRFRSFGPEQRIDLKPVAGRLVMIPAWLIHSVAPWQGKGSRISIAINLSAKPR